MAENTVPVLSDDQESGPLHPPGEEKVTQTGSDDGSEAYLSEESPLRASEEQHRAQTVRGRGRPKGIKASSNVSIVERGILVPSPPFRIYKSDATDINQRFKPFANYWNALPRPCKDHVYAYVYRDHPVLLQPEFKDGEPEDFKYIDKISGNEPLQDELDLLHRYGCGSYRILLNEVNVPGKSNRTLCTVFVMNTGGGDYKSNPPSDRRINDVDNLDQNHPSNTAYISYLKSQGALKKGDDMATATVVDRLLDQNKELTDRAVKSAQQPPPKTDGVNMADAMRMGMEVVADAATRSNEMLQKAAEQSRQMNPIVAPAATTPAVDPMEMALKIVALLQDGKGKNDPEVVQLRQQVEQLRTDQVSMLREELKSMREQMSTRNTGNPFSSIQEGMKAMKDMKTVVDEISGAGNDKGIVEEVAGAVGPAWLAKYAPLMQQGFGLVDSFFRYRAAMSGNPMPPQPPPGYPMAPQPGFPPNPQAYPQPQPQSPQQVSAPPLPPGFPPELANLLMRISRSLHYHLADINATGTDFASWFMSGEGDETYTEIQGFGVEGIIGALTSFPVTAQIVNQFPPERIQSFVAEFIAPQFEEEDKGEGSEDTPGPVAVDPPKDPQPA